jgi:IclR family transcriptional regulator, acetate operon repressor
MIKAGTLTAEMDEGCELGHNHRMRNVAVDDSPTSVLERALNILSCFERSDRTVTLADLARRAAMPKSTVHRLASQLTLLGLLRQDDHGYRLGLRLFELGEIALEQAGLVVKARPILADLHRTTNATVHLAILDEFEVLYLAKVASSGAPDVPSRVGGRMPAYCTAIGKALLAFAPHQVVVQCIENGLRRRTSRTIIAPGILLTQLRDVRNGAFAFEYEESAPGIVCVATPVLDRGRSPIAALSVADRVTVRGTRHLEPALQRAASQLGQALSL